MERADGPIVGVVNTENNRRLEVSSRRAAKLLSREDGTTYRAASEEDLEAIRGAGFEVAGAAIAQADDAGEVDGASGRCEAQTSSGRRCRNDAQEGSRFCAVHQPEE